MHFIIQEDRIDLKQAWYVAAPPGYYRKANGSLAKDGCFSGGPEWTKNRNHAHHFQSRISAKRVANKCLGRIRIIEVQPQVPKP